MEYRIIFLHNRKRLVLECRTGGDREAEKGQTSGMNFGTLLRNTTNRYRDNTAVWCEGESLTHGELFERSCRFANALTARGLDKGDRVALLGPNGLEQPEQMVGAAFGGFVRVTCYAHETGEVNAYMIGLTEARILILHWAHYERMRPHLSNLTSLESIWVYGGAAPEGTESYEEILAAASPQFRDIETSPDDLHVIRFSAGTTGRPKGIVHTLGAWLAVNNEYRWVTPQLDEHDAYLCAGQLSHAALLWFWQTLEVGGRIVLMPTFDAGEFLRLVEEQKCTVTLLVPTMISAILAHPDLDDRDVSSMRCLNYAASPIAERTMARAIEKFGNVLYQLYAQSEVPIVTMLQPYQHVPDGTDAERMLMRSVGRPSPATNLIIVDDDGSEVEIGEIGEIAVKNDALMLGIWQNPEATAERFLKNGYMLTRDMGYLDENGFLFIADRKEDMIISGGYNIWPAEVENAVAAHPGVHEVCVVGVPHEKWGETPKAYVVTVPGIQMSADEIIAKSREVLGPIKKVTSVEFVSVLPKSGVGKILRRELKSRQWGESKIRVGGA